MIAALLWVAATATATPAAAAAAEARPEPILKPGDDAPMFAGALYNPQAAGASSFDLGSLAGDGAEDATAAKAVLVSFFASFCEPCKRELPLLQKLSKEYAARGLRVVSIAIDREPERMKDAEALITKNGITFPVVKDRFNLISRRWLGKGRAPLPSLFIVGRDGVIKLVKQGYEDDAAAFLRSEIERALSGAPAPAAAEEVPATKLAPEPEAAPAPE